MSTRQQRRNMKKSQAKHRKATTTRHAPEPVFFYAVLFTAFTDEREDMTPMKFESPIDVTEMCCDAHQDLFWFAAAESAGVGFEGCALGVDAKITKDRAERDAAFSEYQGHVFGLMLNDHSESVPAVLN